MKRKILSVALSAALLMAPSFGAWAAEEVPPPAAEGAAAPGDTTKPTGPRTRRAATAAQKAPVAPQYPAWVPWAAGGALIAGVAVLAADDSTATTHH